MMQFEIMIHCPELVDLAHAIQGFKVLPDLTPVAEPTPAPEPVVLGVTDPEPSAAPISAESVVPAAEAVLVTYDKETLVRAAAELMDQGKQQELLDLLARFNVPSMMALDPAQFGAFGHAMKEMGAKL